MKRIAGGVTQPKGFLANGLCCGIKRSGKSDLALIASTVPATAVGVLTRNSIQAAPIQVCRRHLRNGRAQAILVNSGNANCFTGEFGRIYAEKTAAMLGQFLNIPTEDVLVASTGIIGKPLPVRKIFEAIPRLIQGLSPEGETRAAEAILTTDTVIKQSAVRLRIGGQRVTLGACAKGSGMIAPNMATMLAFITTDAVVSPQALSPWLRSAVEKSFNMITVDGCMSTNDMVVCLANGQAGHPSLKPQSRDGEALAEALDTVCLDLAKQIVRDGEGATKFITVSVTGARTPAVARKIALQVANSNLVKTAAFGQNPNWGRVAAAVGATGTRVKEKDLRIEFSSFQKKDITIHVHLNQGPAAARAYTCDLSHDYIKINAEYN